MPKDKVEDLNIDEETEKALEDIANAPEPEEGNEKPEAPNKEADDKSKEDKPEEKVEKPKEEKNEEIEEKEEKTEEEDKKEEDGDEEDEEDEELDDIPKESRKAKMVESWRVEVAKKKLSKEFEGSKKEMEDQITTLKKDLEVANEKASKADKDEAVENAIEKLVSDSGVEEKTVRGLVDIIGKKFNVTQPKAETPTSLENDRLAKLEAEVEDARQEKIFDKEYNRDIVKLIETDIPEKSRTKAKKLLHDLAFTKEYSEVPLKELYRNSALDDFKTDVETKKGTKSATPSEQRPKGEPKNVDDIGPDSTPEEIEKFVNKKSAEGEKMMFGADKQKRKSI